MEAAQYKISSKNDFQNEPTLDAPIFRYGSTDAPTFRYVS